jgi:hypothetical protein
MIIQVSILFSVTVTVIVVAVIVVVVVALGEVIVDSISETHFLYSLLLPT